MKVRWTHAARADLRAIVAYISAENRQAALHLSGSIYEATRRVAQLPYSGRVVPELG